MKKFFLFIVSCLILPSFVFAQTQLEAQIVMTPSIPQPNSRVVLTLESYSFNVDVANIVWTVSGKIFLSGRGEKKINLATGGVGSQINVSVSATLADGSSMRTSTVITPGSVEILYESPESYVPPFYKGRTLPSEGATVRVTAIANISENGALVAKNKLSYSWYLNDELLSGASGAGKQSATIKLDYLNDANEVKVRIVSPGGVISEKTTTIYPHSVIPALYTYDELLGTNYTLLVGRRFEASKDFSLVLEPYYLSTLGTASGGDTYEWYLDGLPITPIGGKKLSLSPKADSYGTRTLSIAITNTKRRLQTAETSVELLFDTRK